MRVAKLKSNPAASTAFPVLSRLLRAASLLCVTTAISLSAMDSASAGQLSGPRNAGAGAEATASVKTPGRPAKRQPIAARVEMMVEGGGVRGPRGYERFCRLDPRYCAPPSKRRPGALVNASRNLVKQLEGFNKSVNSEFQPGRDQDIYGVSDHWTFPTSQADCEDYVLAKQARLLKAGWPREALLIGVVVGQESPFHAVLIVRTSKGELVLDNMRDEVLDWRETGYRWVIRQSAKHPERWVRIRSDAPATTAPSSTASISTSR